MILVGGRVSDKFVTENCGFLEKLLPGDMVVLRQKFTILKGTLPTDYLISNHENCNRHTPMVVHMIRVCAALVNFCPPFAPFD